MLTSTTGPRVWIRGGSSDGHRILFAITENPCEYGNFYVSVTNKHRYTAYLFPDMSLRTKAAFNHRNHGYCQTFAEAEKMIDKFLDQQKKKVEAETVSAATDSVLNQMLKDALDDFVDNEKMFTAFDVTTKVRDDNPGLHVYHTVVKNYVHGQFENGGLPGSYGRTLIPIASPNPWLYYIPGKHDPNTYAAQPVVPANAGQIPTKQVKVTLALPQSVVKRTDQGRGNTSFIKRAKDAIVATFGGITGGKD